ncbi:MAG: IPTL-CTERM sorting domain-containing protein [Gammaproteobacteria bacterium]|nr:IPTL-CTERM sorting domain-containing protein [Gammaproteobacteria bacterium]
MNTLQNSLTAVGMSAMLLAGSALAQDNYVDWAAAGKPDLAPVAASAPDAPLGGLTTFVDQASFDAATGGFAPETFDNGLTPPGAVATCNNTIDSTTTGPCFNAGDLIPGFSVTFLSNGGTGGLVALGGGFLGAAQTTTVVGANSFVDNTEITFSPAVTAAAFEGFGVAGDYLITALDSGGATIGSFTVTGAAVDGGVFAGFTSPVPVTTVVVDGVGGAGELIDNLQFGDPAVGPDLPPPPQVPTLSQFGLLLLAGLMLVVGVFAYRRFAA